MSDFKAGHISLKGGFVLDAPLEEAFPLFSPEGETHWVPGWDPEILHPPEGRWETGLIFRTREEFGEAVWVVSQLDRASHRVIYHRVEPGRYVARVEVECKPVTTASTEVRTAYSFTGLSEAGNSEIESMSPEAYDAKMDRWVGWLRSYLTRSS